MQLNLEFLQKWQKIIQESELYSWSFFLAAILLSFMISLFFRPPLKRIMSIIINKLFSLKNEALVKKLIGPLQLFLGLIIFFCFNLLISGPKQIEDIMRYATTFVLFFAIAYLGLRIIDLLFSRAMHLQEGVRSRIAGLLPLTRRLLKLAVILLAVLMLLSHYGVDISALLVGLGVGSLAIALAAQKILENLFGGAAISLDQPFQVGDFIKFGQEYGTVSEIGIRSTRMHTMENTIVSLPNSVLSQMTIENFATREKIRLHHVLHVSLDTEISKLKSLMKGIKETIAENKNFDNNSLRVNLKSMTELGHEIEISTYVMTKSYAEFAKLREQLLFSILSLMDSSYISLAVPERKVYQ